MADLPQQLAAAVLRGGIVFLDAADARPEKTRSLLFENPVTILRCNDPEEVPAFFAQLEQALKEGLFAAGYAAYELGLALEPSLVSLCPCAMPLAWFGLYQAPQIFEETASLTQAALLASPLASLSPRMALARERYLDEVRAIQEGIAAGEMYQVNHTLRADFEFEGTPLDLYLALRESQPAPYAAFLTPEKGQALLSLSPELFFEIRGGKIRLRPMKGTAPRGPTPGLDASLKKALSGSEKDRAENAMIVDLIRNDVGRLAVPGTVKVAERFVAEPFGAVWQLSSQVEATLKRGLSWQEIFSALFPCGSITGAPKIRAMRWIERLEPEPRGPYCGAVGFIEPGGDACFNVAIRTLELCQKKENQWRGKLGVGGGITGDSNPAREYDEALLKAHFLSEPRPPFRLLETFGYFPGKGFVRQEAHLARMASSAQYFGFRFDLVAARSLLENQAKSFTSSQRIRLLCDRWGGMRLEAMPFNPAKAPSDPIRLVLSSARVDPASPFLYHKTTHRTVYDQALQEAKARRAQDAILLNTRGEVTETTFRNLFIKRDGRWLTPARSSGLLPGVFRETWLKETPGAAEAVLFREDLEKAEILQVGNSLRGLQSAVLWCEETQKEPLPGNFWIKRI